MTLFKLGHQPAKIRNADHWYLSPLRKEITPSFEVNRKINRWYDHGLGKGGNIIDFAILYHSCSASEFLQKVDDDFSLHQPIVDPSNRSEPDRKITIIQDFSINSFSLIKYLQQRKIPLEIAEQFCREVRYDFNGKSYYGIGFKNDSGGYEIRNPYFKAGSSSKDVTTFNNAAKEVSVFEGFRDFLSYIVIRQNQSKIDSDFLILNSASFFEKSRLFMDQHDTISLFLDNDSTGQKFGQLALSISKKYKDASKLYRNYKDLNEWLINSRNKQKKNLRQKLCYNPPYEKMIITKIDYS